MCIVFSTLDHPDYSLILCSNRDEFLNRPTTDAAFHSFEHDHEARSSAPGAILSGIDKMGSGTWLGISRTGKVAALTNITEELDPSIVTSRGSLVSSFLLLDSDEPLDEQVKKCFPRDTKYSGFNLLLFAPRVAPATSPHPSDLDAGLKLQYDASLITNGGACGPITSRRLSAKERSRGGFSNGVDGKGGSEWPKVIHGLQDFENLISQVTQASDKQTDESELADRLFGLLSWKSPEPVTERRQLRNTVEVVPYPATWGGSVQYYGTRLSTVLFIRRNGQVTFIERDIWKLVDGKVTRLGGNVDDNNNSPPSERTYRFQLDLRSPPTPSLLG
ncbi:DUF833-domain-containing protein [Marasmius fiardii PR-910]|nr:DUF833-domain-containing protein [Marasmius fiardii PR-910]